MTVLALKKVVISKKYPQRTAGTLQGSELPDLNHFWRAASGCAARPRDPLTISRYKRQWPEWFFLCAVT